MKTLNRKYAVVIALLITAGTGCRPPIKFINTGTLSGSAAKDHALGKEYKGYALRPLLNGGDSWEGFKEKAVFCTRYNDLRISELRSYLKKYYFTEDPFYEIRLRELTEKNQSMKRRIETFNKEKDPMGIFKLVFQNDMDLLMQELSDFTVYR